MRNIFLFLQLVSKILEGRSAVFKLCSLIPIVNIEFRAHYEYAIPFVDSMKHFWHQPIETIEQKTSKLNHVSFEFGAWSFLQVQGYFGVEDGGD